MTGSGGRFAPQSILQSVFGAYNSVNGHLGTIEAALNRLEVALAMKSRSQDTDANGNSNLQKVTRSVQDTWETLTVSLKGELEQYHDTLTETSVSTGTLEGARSHRGLINIVSDAGKCLFVFSIVKEVKQLKKNINALVAKYDNFTHLPTNNSHT